MACPITQGHFHSVVNCLWMSNWLCTTYMLLGVDWNHTNKVHKLQASGNLWLTVLFQSDLADRRPTIFQTQLRSVIWSGDFQNKVWSLVSPITLRPELAVSTLTITSGNTNLCRPHWICTRTPHSPESVFLYFSAYVLIHFQMTSSDLYKILECTVVQLKLNTHMHTLSGDCWRVMCGNWWEAHIIQWEALTKVSLMLDQAQSGWEFSYLVATSLHTSESTKKGT